MPNLNPAALLGQQTAVAVLQVWSGAVLKLAGQLLFVTLLQPSILKFGGTGPGSCLGRGSQWQGCLSALTGKAILVELVDKLLGGRFPCSAYLTLLPATLELCVRSSNSG